jgi:multidrug transporter EmrE-like cation transporter
MPDSAIAPMPVRFRPAVWAGVAILGVMAAGTVLLWVHYGSAVFFEMIMAGIAACF